MKKLLKERFKFSFQELLSLNYFKNKKSFAESMSVTPQFLSQLLNDTTPIPLDFAARYIEKYPINSGFLFNENEKEVFKFDAPHLLQTFRENISYVDKPSSMSNAANRIYDTGRTLNNSLSSVEGDDKKEMLSLLLKLSQVHLEIARTFDKMYNERK